MISDYKMEMDNMKGFSQTSTNIFSQISMGLALDL